MEVTLSAEQEALCLRIASRTGRKAEAVAQEAALPLLENAERLVAAVEQGLASLDPGESISQAGLKRRIENPRRS